MRAYISGAMTETNDYIERFQKEGAGMSMTENVLIAVIN